MKIGLFGIGFGACADPAVAGRVARHAEAAGLDSLWTGEHVVLPDPREPPSPAEPDLPMLHPSTIFAYLAGVTKTIRFGTGIILIAQRNPLVLAKEMASLDVVCEGRLILGIGAGYLHQEFDALGIPFHERGVRTDEYLAILRTLWNDPQPSHQGRFYRFDGIQAMPRPRQAGGPPIVIGGWSDAALRRTENAQGWYGYAMNVERTAEVLGRLREIRGDEAFAALELSVTPSLRIDAEAVERFAELGIHRLVSLIPSTEKGMLELVDDLSKLAD